MTRIAGCLLAVVAAAPTVAAAEPAWQLVPTVGFRTESDVSGVYATGSGLSSGAVLGLAVDRRLAPDTAIEATWLARRSDLEVAQEDGGVKAFDVDVHTLDVAGVYRPPRPTGRVRPFVEASFGLVYTGARSPGTGSATTLSFAVGGGWQIPLGERLSLRITGRGRAVFDDAAFGAVCGPGCSANLVVDGGFQFEGTVGLAFGL